MKILVVEDDLSLLDVVSRVFQEESYQVDQAENGDDGLFLAEQDIYDLIVLDIMLPGLNGLSVVKRLRAQSRFTPVLLLTARDSVEDKVKGLDIGADDYLVKPFEVRELLARARALLRRNGASSADGQFSYRQITIKPKYYDGYINDIPLQLTVKEYELFEFLLINQEQILTREQIFDRIWGFESETGYGIVDVYIHYLRKKLAAHRCDHLLHTIRGVGYMLKEKTLCLEKH